MGKTVLVAIVICLICSLFSTKPVFCSMPDTKIGLFYYVWYGEYDEQNKTGARPLIVFLKTADKGVWNGLVTLFCSSFPLRAVYSVNAHVTLSTGNKVFA